MSLSNTGGHGRGGQAGKIIGEQYDLGAVPWGSTVAVHSSKTQRAVEYKPVMTFNVQQLG